MVVMVCTLSILQATVRREEGGGHWENVDWLHLLKNNRDVGWVSNVNNITLIQHFDCPCPWK